MSRQAYKNWQNLPMPIAITSIKNVPLQVQKNSQKPKPKSVCDTQYSTEQFYPATIYSELIIYK